MTCNEGEGMMKRRMVLAAVMAAALAGVAEKLPPLPDGAFTYVV